MARVDRVLAADRAVDLGHQGGGDLDEVDAAHEQRRGEARDVAHDPAAERDHHRGPVDPRGRGADRAAPPDRGTTSRPRRPVWSPCPTGRRDRRAPARDGTGRHRESPASVTTTTLRPATMGSSTSPAASSSRFSDYDVVSALSEVDADGSALAHAALFSSRSVSTEPAGPSPRSGQRSARSRAGGVRRSARSSVSAAPSSR